MQAAMPASVSESSAVDGWSAAIGFKNWMVAGAEDGAERASLLMSLVGACQMP